MNSEEATLRVKLQLYLTQCLKCLQESSSQTLDFIGLVEYLIGLVDTHTQFQTQFAFYSIDSVRREFKRSFYSICFREILVSLNSASGHELKKIKTILIKIIGSSNFTDSFNILYEFCVHSSQSNQRDFCQFLMKQYLVKHLLKDLFLENIHTIEEGVTKREMKNLVEESIVQKIINLPDKLANLNLRSLKNYFKIVATDLLLSIKTVHETNSSKKILFNFEFISTIYGKMSILGYSEILGETFLNKLIKMCFKDTTGQWSLVTQSFFKSIGYKYLESCLVNLIKAATCYEDIQILIGNSVVSNKDVQYLMLEKFLFVKTLNKEISIQILIGYVYNSQPNRELYYNTFKKLLNTWSLQTSIANTSYEQHLYLTKCILVCQSYWDDADKELLSQDLMKLLLKGVEQHLHSPMVNLRTIGMIVGENLMNELNKDYNSNETAEKNILKFEYDESAETFLLKSLKQKPTAQSSFKNLDNDFIDLESIQSKEVEEKKTKTEKTLFVDNKNLKITINEEDSDDDDDDDDFVPFDTSNDKPLSKSKQPAYLRDCLDALIFSEDPEKIEISMKSVQSLCTSYHFELQEICVELLKVLLHKSNAFAIENFEDIRLNAMISVTVHYPIESATYLTSQFYDAGFSMTQRTDILHTLVMSIQRLSNPNEDPIFDKRLLYSQVHLNTGHNLIAFNQSLSSSQSKDWKLQVQKRIDSKTKIKKTAKTTVTKSKENKYSEVYGYFFFPLLRPYDVNRVHLNILEQDFMLLGKLIFSLAVILYSSANTLILENMIKALLDFIWALKNHKEPFVRNSILFALTLILIVMPKNLLLTTANNYLIEMKFWLENIVINDPSLECQKKAIECLTIFSQRMKEQFINSDNS